MSAKYDELKWQSKFQSSRMLNRDQVQTILEDVTAQHTIKLDALAAFERREANPQLDEGRYDSLISGLAHLLAAKRGPGATFTPDDVSLLNEHGLPPLSAEHVDIQLEELRRRRFLPPPLGKLEDLLARHRLESTPSTIAQADSAYLLGLARALLDVDSRWPKFSASALEEFNATQSLALNRESGRTSLEIRRQAKNGAKEWAE